MNTTTPDQGIGLEQMLQQYKHSIDADIKTYSNALVQSWAEIYGEYSKQGIQAYVEVLSRGGKRMRGALVMNAYDMCGGTNVELAIGLARVVEMLHAYILITDDICDHSDLRRGGPTAHRLLEAYHREEKMHGDSYHFGVSQAINAALSGCHLAMLELGKLPIDADLKLRLMNHLNEAFIITANGQINDIFNEAIQEVSEEQVLQMLEWKTAYYSFWNPIVVGAMLAGADVESLESLRSYSMHAGLSFQISDDIIGTFGDSDNSGKSTTDDLAEGKITMLVAYAMAHATPHEKRLLLAVLGQPNVSNADYEAAKQMLVQTNALGHANELADLHARQALESLDNLGEQFKTENVQFLRELASSLTSRKS